jgi:hypothetical protein
MIGAGYLFSGDFEKGKNLRIRVTNSARKQKPGRGMYRLKFAGCFLYEHRRLQTALDLFHQTLDKAVAANLPDRVPWYGLT